MIPARKTHDLDLRGDVIELFAWLHGPYRTLGIGRHYVGVAIDWIRERLNPEDRGLPLRVDYPMDAMSPQVRSTCSRSSAVEGDGSVDVAIRRGAKIAGKAWSGSAFTRAWGSAGTSRRSPGKRSSGFIVANPGGIQ